MSFFKKRFKTLLEQDETLGLTDAEAMETQLGDGLSGDDLKVDAPQQSPEQLAKANDAAQAKELTEWIDEMDNFVSFLNGESGSIQTQLHDASCDTLFDKIASAETKKIARVAMDLSALVQNFKGYLHSANI